MGIGLAAFVYGLATDFNGKCNAEGHFFCAVVRIALGFVTLNWFGTCSHSVLMFRVLFLCGFITIMRDIVRRPRSQELL